MNRRIVVSTLAAVAIAGSLSPVATAAEPGQWRAGTNYQVLAQPRPPQVARGKVEVNEVFWYGCGHCYALDPTLERWNAGGKPAFVNFVRIPVVWGPMHRQHARLYYTLQALDRHDLHAAVFDAIHQKGNMLAAQTDEQARALHLAFFKEHGVTEKAFNKAYDSDAVSDGIKFAQRATGEFEVASVPLMIVQGRYTTSVSQAGGEGQLLALINDLATREQQRR